MRALIVTCLLLASYTAHGQASKPGSFRPAEAGTAGGDVTVTTPGSTPNNNGLTLTAQQLKLEYADATHPGILKASGAQTVGATLTLSALLTASAGVSTTTGAFSSTITSSIASGSNGYTQATGARLDFGAGATDYATSDGTTVTFAGPLSTAGAFAATTGAFSNTVTSTVASGSNGVALLTGARLYLGASGVYVAGDGTNVVTAAPLKVTGAAFPSTDATVSLGSTTNRWLHLYGVDFRDNGDNIRFETGFLSPNAFQGTAADGASAIGNKFANSTALTTPGAVIANFYSDSFSTLRLSVDRTGSIIPASNAVTQNLGDSSHRFLHGYIYDLTDDNNVQRLVYGGGANGMIFTSVAPDGATAIGLEMNNSATLSTDGAKLARWNNNGTEKINFRLDGAIQQTGIATGSFPTCNAAHEGSYQYDTTLHVAKICDATSWKTVTAL